MQFGDVVNGLFEALGAVCIWMNVFQLMKDKEVKGICWQVTAFFTLWGFWNLWYYPSLGQWWSTAGGAALAFGNLFWIVLAFKYARRAREK